MGIGTLVLAAIGAVSAVSSYQQGQAQKKAAEMAVRQAQANAERQVKAAEEAANRANQKKPNTGAILDAVAQASKAGVSGTMLTGPQGIDSSTLPLGRNTLLGR